MDIREATPADLPAIEELYVRSVRANPDGFIQDLSYHGDIKDFVRRVQQGGGLFAVGTLDGRVVAMGALKKDDADRAELCKLHVSAEHQGKGHGRHLSSYLLRKASALGLREVELHVTTSQKAAIALYRKLGFIEEKTEVWSGSIGGRIESYETVFMRHLIQA